MLITFQREAKIQEGFVCSKEDDVSPSCSANPAGHVDCIDRTYGEETCDYNVYDGTFSCE